MNHNLYLTLYAYINMDLPSTSKHFKINTFFIVLPDGFTVKAMVN